MKKKLIGIIIVIAILLSFAACDISLEQPEETTGVSSGTTKSSNIITHSVATEPPVTDIIPSASQDFQRVLSDSMKALSDNTSEIFSAMKKSSESVATSNLLVVDAIFSSPFLEELLPDGLISISFDALLLSDGKDLSAKVNYFSDASVGPMVIDAYYSEDGNLYFQMPDHMDKYVSIPLNLADIDEDAGDFLDEFGGELGDVVNTENLEKISNSLYALIDESIGLMLKFVPESAYRIDTITHLVGESDREVEAEKLTLELSTEQILDILKDVALEMKNDNAVLFDFAETISDMLGDKLFIDEINEVLDSIADLDGEELGIATLTLEAIYDRENLYDIAIIVDSEDNRIDFMLILDPYEESFLMSLFMQEKNDDDSLGLEITNGFGSTLNDGYKPFWIIVDYVDGEDYLYFSVDAEYEFGDDLVNLLCDVSLYSDDIEFMIEFELSLENSDGIRTFVLYVDSFYLIVEDERLLGGRLYVRTDSQELSEIPEGRIIPDLGEVVSEDDAEDYLEDLFEILSDDPGAFPLLILFMLII